MIGRIQTPTGTCNKRDRCGHLSLKQGEESVPVITKVLLQFQEEMPMAEVVIDGGWLTVSGSFS